MTKRTTRRLRRLDRNGGIEGLPLQLMIMVLIAGVGTAILVGWMSGLEAPQSIGSVRATPSEIIVEDANRDGVFDKTNFEMTVTVMDQKGDGISGASVVLDGANLRKGTAAAHGTTDTAGKVTLSGLSCSLSSDRVGYVRVIVSRAGYGNDATLTIPVIAG
jgi:hypothetical protein